VKGFSAPRVGANALPMLQPRPEPAAVLRLRQCVSLRLFGNRRIVGKIPADRLKNTYEYCLSGGRIRHFALPRVWHIDCSSKSLLSASEACAVYE
jgi:hypothetical protein